MVFLLLKGDMRSGISKGRKRRDWEAEGFLDGKGGGFYWEGGKKRVQEA